MSKRKKKEGKELITASLTSVVSRRESLKDTVESLLPQVDKLNVYLHGYTDKPEFLENVKITVAFDIEWGDYGDIDKMAWVDEVKGYHLICDDDLIYPPDYAEKAIEALERYNRKKVISFHGCTFKRFPIASYYSDRIVYPCLGTVHSDVDADLIGTGVMAYHSDLPIGKIDLKGKFPNMLDIHFGIWCKQNGIEYKVIAHREGWIQHTTKINMKDTIFEKAVNNDFFQTDLIMKNADLFQSPQPDPLVTIVVVNSRLRRDRNVVKLCFDSIREQSEQNYEVIVFDNMLRLQTIGKAFNEAVKKARSKWCLFIGDDDMISTDYISSMLAFANAHRDNLKVVGVTSYLTMFSATETELQQEPRELIPTGMWKTNHLLKHPFSEFLTKYVDSEYMDRMVEEKFELGIMKWHYGYYYRSHPDQISGHKVLISDSNPRDEHKESLRSIK